MEPHCLGKPTDPGAAEATTAASWKRSFGSCGRKPWRDLLPFFGNWNTIFKRYRDWVKADVFKEAFRGLLDAPDMEYAMVDATIVKVHRHGQGAKGTQSRIMMSAIVKFSIESRARARAACAKDRCELQLEHFPRRFMGADIVQS